MPSFSTPAARAPTVARIYEYSEDPYFRERVNALDRLTTTDTPAEFYYVPLMLQAAERLVSFAPLPL
jgi:hypothetical protein